MKTGQSSLKPIAVIDAVDSNSKHEGVEFDVLEGLSIRCSNENQARDKAVGGRETRTKILVCDPGALAPRKSGCCVPQWWESAQVRAEIGGRRTSKKEQKKCFCNGYIRVQFFSKKRKVASPSIER